MHKTHISISLCKIIDRRKLKSPSQGRRATILQMRLRKGWRTAPLSASVLVRSGGHRGVWPAGRLKVHKILTNLGHSHTNCSFLHGCTGESSSETRPGHPAAGLFLSGQVYSHFPGQSASGSRKGVHDLQGTLQARPCRPAEREPVSGRAAVVTQSKTAALERGRFRPEVLPWG